MPFDNDIAKLLVLRKLGRKLREHTGGEKLQLFNMLIMWQDSLEVNWMF